MQSGSKKDDDGEGSKKKKKKRVVEKKDEEAEVTLFKKETDPSELGKALGDKINRATIIGVLLMLMVLPLLSRSEVDYSGTYALREAFWFGRSGCSSPNGFYCNEKKWITIDGWSQVLRGVATSSDSGAFQYYDENKADLSGLRKELLWLYLPDWTRNGTLNTITSIAPSKVGRNDGWTQTDECAGFKVSSDCPWRVEEMLLIGFTPDECFAELADSGCDDLVAYARFQFR